MVSQKEQFQEMVFQMGVSENVFQETGFSGSDFQEGDFENAIPVIGFLCLVP